MIKRCLANNNQASRFTAIPYLWRHIQMMIDDDLALKTRNGERAPASISVGDAVIVKHRLSSSILIEKWELRWLRLINNAIATKNSSIGIRLRIIRNGAFIDKYVNITQADKCRRAALPKIGMPGKPTASTGILSYRGRQRSAIAYHAFQLWATMLSEIMRISISVLSSISWALSIWRSKAQSNFASAGRGDRDIKSHYYTRSAWNSTHDAPRMKIFASSAWNTPPIIQSCMRYDESRSSVATSIACVWIGRSRWARRAA